MGQIWSGSDTPSVEEIVQNCYKQAEWFFRQDYVGLHVIGLLHLEWFLCAIEAITCTPLHPVKVSQEVTSMGLKTVETLLTNWEPFEGVGSGKMISYVRANIPQSCQTLLQSISEIARRLSDVECDNLQHNPHNLVQITDKAEHAMRVLMEKCSPYYNCECCVWANGNFLAIKAIDDDNGWFSTAVRTLSNVITKRGFPPLKVATFESTPMTAKLKGLLWTGLISASTDPICQICHGNLEDAKSLSFLVSCNHVCCSICILTWFKQQTTTQRNW